MSGSIPIIVDQHAENAAFLWLLRDAAVLGANYTLEDLAELDNRVEANLDGLRVAENLGWTTSRSALELGEPGEIFAAASLAVENADGAQIDEVLKVAAQSRDNIRAFVSALGWFEYTHIEAVIETFLSANSNLYQHLGLSACAINRVDPGEILIRHLGSDSLPLRTRALRAVGELKRADLASTTREHWQAEDEHCRFWALWSSVLLGDTDAAMALKAFVRPGSPFADRAVQVIARVISGELLQNWLASLARDENTRRFALLGAGYSGDPFYMPGLFNQMEEPDFARVAGEAFSMITGADLAYLDLEVEWPQGYESGPTDDPEDENVDLDPDEDLPWPGRAPVEAWWTEHSASYTAGERYLCGARISESQCESVLATGYQRQRHAAALELALMGDAVLPEVRAPGYRQRKKWPS
ncbi:MAG: TIGR02270 family protein [Pseudomonadota bacterium]